MENVKKCKNFLSTLIKLASSGKQSTETAANVKELVQHLLVRGAAGTPGLPARGFLPHARGPGRAVARLKCPQRPPVPLRTSACSLGFASEAAARLVRLLTKCLGCGMLGERWVAAG